MPSFCDKSCTKVVVCPWPLSCMPEYSVHVARSTFSRTVSPGPPPQRSMYIAEADASQLFERFFLFCEAGPVGLSHRAFPSTPPKSPES